MLLCAWTPKHKQNTTKHKIYTKQHNINTLKTYPKYAFVGSCFLCVLFVLGGFGLVSFGVLLGPPGSGCVWICLAVATCGCPWLAGAGFGRLWPAAAGRACCFRLRVAVAGCGWLCGPVAVWSVAVAVTVWTCLWLVVAGCGWRWLALCDSGWLWLAVASCSRLWQALAWRRLALACHGWPTLAVVGHV